MIREVPLAALAAVLMFAGYKLTAPKIFREAWWRGPEQLQAVVVTLAGTLMLGLLKGIALGLVFVIFTHLLLSGLSPWGFLWSVFVVRPSVSKEDGGARVLRSGPVVNFLTLPWIARALGQDPGVAPAIVDFSATRLIDPVALEYLFEVQEQRARAGTPLELLGMGLFSPVSDHPLALRHRSHSPHRTLVRRLSARQERLQAMARRHHWTYRASLDWTCQDLHGFHFFSIRPLIFRQNVVSGAYQDLGVAWTTADLTFDEGVYLAAEEHHITAQVIQLPRQLPVFTLGEASFIGDLLSRAGVTPDFQRYEDFPRDWMLTGPDHPALAGLFTSEQSAFFEEEEYSHIECTGRDLLVFQRDRRATPREWMALVRYGEKLVRLLLGHPALEPENEELGKHLEEPLQ